MVLKYTHDIVDLKGMHIEKLKHNYIKSRKQHLIYRFLERLIVKQMLTKHNHIQLLIYIR